MSKPYESKGLRVESYTNGFIIADHHPKHGGASIHGETYRGVSGVARSQPVVEHPFLSLAEAEAAAEKLAATYEEYRQ